MLESMSSVWRPKVFEKVDYKPIKMGVNGYFTPAVIEKIFNEHDPAKTSYYIHFKLKGEDE